jgi:hypothetical protein
MMLNLPMVTTQNNWLKEGSGHGHIVMWHTSSAPPRVCVCARTWECAQGLLNLFPLPSVVLTGAQGVLNHIVQGKYNNGKRRNKKFINLPPHFICQVKYLSQFQQLMYYKLTLDLGPGIFIIFWAFFKVIPEGKPTSIEIQTSSFFKCYSNIQTNKGAPIL